MKHILLATILLNRTHHCYCVRTANFFLLPSILHFIALKRTFLKSFKILSPFTAAKSSCLTGLIGGRSGCLDSERVLFSLLLLSSLAAPAPPFCLLLVDPGNVSSFGWASLDCGFTREEGAGRGRGGISENGEEEGIGGGGKVGAGGIIGGIVDAIFLGEQASWGGVLGREEVEEEGEMPKPKPPKLLKLVSEETGSKFWILSCSATSAVKRLR